MQKSLKIWYSLKWCFPFPWYNFVHDISGKHETHILSNGCICWWNCDPDLLLVFVGVKNVVMGMCITIKNSHWVVLNVNVHLGYYHCIIITMTSVVVDIYNLIQTIGVKIYQWKHVNPHNQGYLNGLCILCLIILKLFLCCH